MLSEFHKTISRLLQFWNILKNIVNRLIHNRIRTHSFSMCYPTLKKQFSELLQFWNILKNIVNKLIHNRIWTHSFSICYPPFKNQCLDLRSFETFWEILWINESIIAPERIRYLFVIRLSTNNFWTLAVL